VNILLFNFEQSIANSLNIILLVFAIIIIIIFFITKLLPNVIPQAKIIHYSCIPIFSITLFFLGANWSKSHWLAQLDSERIKVEQAKQQQDIINQELIKERKKTTDALYKGKQDLRDANAKFIEELRKKDVTVSRLLGTLDQVTREKYAALDEKSKLEYQAQLQSVIDFEKRCPIIPELYINKMNDRAKNPSKESKK